MREVEFRGKRVDNGEWEVGSYFKHIKRQVCPIGDELEESDIAHLIIQSGFADWNMPKPLQAIEVIPETVGQYVEILGAYEGDVLYGTEKDEYGSVLSVWYGVVKYNDEQGRLMVFDDAGEWYEVDDYTFDAVVGNIHDNPELLGVK